MAEIGERYGGGVVLRGPSAAALAVQAPSLRMTLSTLISLGFIWAGVDCWRRLKSETEREQRNREGTEADRAATCWSSSLMGARCDR